MRPAPTAMFRWRSSTRSRRPGTSSTLYNRPSPSDVDGGVRALLPTNGLPSYPSEDAVLSGVTAELLKLLFPTNVEEINPEGGRAARGRAALRPGDRQRPRGRPRARQRRGGAVHGPRRHRRHAHRWRLAGAVRGPRRGGDRARRDPVAQPRVATASAHAGRVRQRPGVDDDPGGRPHRAAAGAAFDVLGADGARGRGGSQCRPQADPRADCHRLQVGRWPEHADAARPLERDCRAVHRRRRLQRSADRAGLRAPQHEPARRRGRAAGTPSSPTTIRGRRSWIRASGRSSACRTSRPIPQVTRRSRRPPRRSCPTCSRPGRESSTRRRTKRRSRGSTAGSTTARTSRSARTTAAASAATR